MFFKHIKTHLRIKSFVGTSENAVKIQTWTSLIATVLFKSQQQMAKYKWHLSNLINALRVHLFAEIERNQFINKPFEKSSHWVPENIQLSLFTWVKEGSKSRAALLQRLRSDKIKKICYTLRTFRTAVHSNKKDAIIIEKKLKRCNPNYYRCLAQQSSNLLNK